MPLALKKSGRKARNSYTRSSAPAKKSSGGKGAGVRLGGVVAGIFKRLTGFSGLKSLAALTVLLACFGLIIAGVCYSSLWLYNKAITSDFFTTRHVDVTGNVRLSHDMVLQDRKSVV